MSYKISGSTTVTSHPLHENTMLVTDSCIMRAEYFPSVQWFQTILPYRYVLLNDLEPFKKSTSMNRCSISGPNGKHLLSVPLEGGRSQHRLIREVRIYNGEHWQQNHFRALCTHYRRAPFFEFFESELTEFFSQEFTDLLSLNLASLQWMIRMLRIKKEVILLSEITDRPLNSDNHPLNTHTPWIYTQPFSHRHGFIDSLSMLDLIFCAGRHP
ncbi:MAG TPA: WbqC family protein [Chitinophagaceae bacterium]|nr:WbqC family protein [Chitinophagaceae bacterium]